MMGQIKSLVKEVVRLSERLPGPSSKLKEFAMHFATSAGAFSYAEDFELVPRGEAKSRHPQPNPKAADRKSQFVIDLIRKMTLANPRWGAPRISRGTVEAGV